MFNLACPLKVQVYYFIEYMIKCGILSGTPGGGILGKKNTGAWSIPKSEFTESEANLTAARREVREELGVSVSGDFIPLLPLKQ